MEILYIVLAVLFLTYPEASRDAAAIACDAMKNVVVRSLFPMMVLSRLISHSRLLQGICNKASKTPLWQRLGLSDALLSAVLSGLLSGFPTTAVETNKLLSEGKITVAEASKAVALASLPSPAFVITVASSSPFAGVMRYALLVATAYLTASRFESAKSCGIKKAQPLGFSEAVSTSISAALSVSASIVFFSAVTCSISSVFRSAKRLVAVFFEMGSAVTLAKGDPWLLSVAVGWCGLSAMCQIKSAAPTLSLKPFVVTRIFSVAVLLVMDYFAEILQNIL